MADALKTGNIGVMDYLNFQNISADTDMRGSIGKLSGDTKGDK
ncbi:flotillin-like FloA family protein, partial [Alkalihalophilus lindianensis]